LGENVEAVLCSSKEIDLEVNTEKAKHMFISHHQVTGHNHDIKDANTSFKNVSRVQIFESNSNRSKLQLKVD
jgi:cephalosporin hydroxylase